MESQFYSGEQTVKRDYTPSGAVAAGEVVVLSNNVYFACAPIAANTLGTLYQGGLWSVAKATTSGSGWADGVLLYWDNSTNQATTTAGSNKKIGVAVGAAADSASTAIVESVPQAV